MIFLSKSLSKLETELDMQRSRKLIELKEST